MKTLEEVAKIVGLKRRAIQEYEAAGLANKPKNRNKYGHLLYDESEIEKLWQLYFYKELGYNIPKIIEHRKKSPYFTEEELKTVISELKKKRRRLDNAIKIAEAMKATGLGFEGMSHPIEVGKDLSAEVAFDFLGTMYGVLGDVYEDNSSVDVMFDDNEFEILLDYVDKIMACFKKELSLECAETQCIIEEWHKSIEDKVADSIIPLEIAVMYISPGSELRELITEGMDEAEIDYLREAIQYYCLKNKVNSYDMELENLLNGIARLGREKFSTNSKEVQEAVGKLYRHLNRLKILNGRMVETMLRMMVELMGSESFKQAYDNGMARGEGWFVSRAIEYYLSNINEEGECKNE